MKRFILTFICLLLSFWLRAQLPYTCRYWFDQNIGQAVTTPLGEGAWQAELDVDVLEMGLHYVHFQVADTSMRWSSPQGFPFIKTANVQPENMPYYYWFDQDHDQMHEGQVGNGIVPLDVNALKTGLHSLHIMMGIDVLTSTKSYLFLKEPGQWSVSNIIYHCWFDQDFEHSVTNVLGNGSLLLDVNSLTDGMHTVHVMLEDSTYTSTQSYLFLKDSSIQGTSDLTCHWWFDTDLENKVTSSLADGNLLMDVSSLAEGVHSVHVMLGDGTYTATQSYLFIKTAVTPEEGVQYQCWFDSDISSLQTGPVGSGIFFIDVTSLPIGEHEMIMQLNDGVLSSPKCYTFYRDPVVLVSANPVEGGTATSQIIDTICTLTATPNVGYHFVNWTMNGEEVSTESVYSFTATEDDAYVANFEINSYEILATVDPMNSGTVVGGGIYNHFATCTLTATPATGYHFVNWTLNGEEVSTNATYSFEVTHPAAYVANFEINSYEILATVAPENTGTVEGTGIYNHFATCTLMATPATGYHFVNWTLNGEEVSNNATYSFEVTNPAVYVANFEINSYEILATVAPENSGTIGGAGIYNHFATCTLTATPATGYHFVNWTMNGEEVTTESVYSFTVMEDASYVANFEINSYEILAIAALDNSGTVEGTGIYNHFATCTLTATANEGYTFINWTLDGEEVSTESVYSFTVTEDAEYVANFEINSYEILATVAPENSGTVEGTGIYNHFATCTLMATANEGYTFVNWTLNGEEVSAESVYSFTVTEGASFVAHFDLNQSGDITQAISFAPGWNWMSTYVEQNGFNGLAMLEEGLGNAGVQIKSQSSYVMNYGGFWMGLLNSIINEQTYLVEANAAVDIELTGLAAQPSEHPISLTNGWNWIGYPSSSSMSLSEACSDFTPANGDELKTQNGFSQYYSGFGWMGTLSTLTPGMGLMYKSNNAETVTFMYPEAIRNSELAENITNEHNHWTNNVHAYPTNMTVTAVVELDDEELASENYELAAFANGEVRGSAKLMYVEPLHRYMAFLTIAGKEETDLHFSLYNTTTGEETLETKDQLTYIADAIVGNPETPKVIRFRSTESLSDLQRNLQVYPNPVSNGENFSLSLPENYKARVEIVNALGTVLSSETTTKTAASIKAPNTAGVYTLRITVEGSGTYTRKLVVK